MAQRVHNDLGRCSEDLPLARRKLARTQADLHASQAAASKTRVLALETARTFVPYQARLIGYCIGFSYAAMQAVRSDTPGKKSFESA